MLIAIDGNEANVARRVGTSEYAFELLRQFKKLSVLSSRFSVYLKEKPNAEFPDESKNWHYKVFGPSKLWTQLALPVRLFTRRIKPDVFFSPGHYAPRFSPVPTVISIMDLAFFHFSEYFTKKDLTQLHSWTKYSVQKAKAIITISQATKDDIIKLYGVPESKIHVIYPGIKPDAVLMPHIYPMQELQTKYAISDKYLLFVGTLQPRKNIVRLIEAFSLLLARHPEDSEGSSKLKQDSSSSTQNDIQLVIVGKKGWKYEDILDAPEKNGITDRVKFLDFVSDEDLQMLYKNAQCFVFPSLYEGFGLPVLEAMRAGCPVITSNVSSLPEAGGDAALYVDPESVSDIASKIEMVLGDKKLRSEMIAKGKEQLKKFSWEKAAKETLSVLEQVGSKQ